MAKATRNKPILIAQIAVFSALVFVATTIIKIPIPATGGYFNIGEGIIFAAALLFGPLVGGIAGGVGAALADVIAFPIFAPATLIIKFFEGAITGYAGNRISQKNTATSFWKILAIALGIGLGAATFYTGYTYMGVFTSDLFNQILWGALAAFLAGFIIYVGFKPKSRTNTQTIAIILGGAIMVTGYFLYENLLALLIPGLGIYAIGEIPFNIGQVLVGMIIALPILRAAERVFPNRVQTKPSVLKS